MKKIFLSPRIVLPVAVLAGVMVMSLRVIDVWNVVTSGRLSLHPAQAEEPATPTKPSKQAAASAPDPVSSKTTTEIPPESSGTEVTIPSDSSPAELEVLKQIAGRRDQLDKRAADLDTREALMKITEQRVDQKVAEMEKLRKQLQAMVGTANEAQQAQLENLVKIYETMKPDEASRILETLDMPILLGVIQRMKPARTAPIMAKMNPEKAKEITSALTKQDQLPQIK